MKLPAYPRTSPSGVEWLGDVPEHWETLALKRRFQIVNGGTPSSSEDTYWEGEIPWFTPEDLGRIETKVIASSRRQITKDGLANCGASLSPRGSVLVSTRAPIGHVAVMGVDGCCNQGCRILVPEGSEVSADFGFYVVVASNAVLNSVGKGTTFLELSAGALGAHFIPLPDPAEQRAIADFLDRETGRVDRLVAKKRELIERLKEKRTALISRTVTRGLPPAAARAAGLPENPPLQPSGLDWLGDIPAHWDVVPFRTKVALREGPGIMRDDFRDDGIPLLRIAGLLSGENGLEGCNYLDPEKVASRWNHFRIIQGDLILSASSSSAIIHIQRARPEMIGAVPYTGLIRLWGKTPETVLDFVAYFIQSQAAQEQLRLLRSGVGIAHFGPTHLKAIRFGFPPRKEQAAIAAYLDEETAKLDALVGKVEEAVERLQEYRTALITAAVTGKIDVRTAAREIKP